MSVAGFEEFANTVGRKASGQGAAVQQPIRRITVLGGGDDACMYAALGLSEGCEVTLFTAYGKELDGIRAAGSITLRGEGPVGSYAVDQTGGPSIKTTAALDDAVSNAEAIILTGPLHKQRTYAMVLADHLTDGQILVLPNARSLGAVEVAWLLQTGGCSARVSLLEIGGAPYWVSRDKAALVLSSCGKTPAAVLPQSDANLVARMLHVFPNADPALSCVHSGFADATAAVELPVLLIGGPAAPSGGPIVPDGAVPLAENATFRHLIGTAHDAVIASLWAERCAVARLFGVRDLATKDEVLVQVAGTHKGTGARPLPSKDAATEAIRSGVVGSLIPLLSAAEIVGHDIPVTRAFIQLAMTVLGRDLTGAGRRLETIGITATDVSQARIQFDNILNRGIHG